MALKKISAKEVMVDVRAGLSNEEIGQKYGLSEKGTQTLFDKLLSANLLTEEEHYQRVASLLPSVDREGDSAGRKQAITTPPEEPIGVAPSLKTSEDDDRAPQAGLARGDESSESAPVPSANVHEGQQQSSAAPAEFIDISQQGKNQWWRYLIGILFILISATTIMGIVFGVFVPNAQMDKTTGSFVGIDSFYNYVLQNLWFVFLFVAIVLVVRVEHKRPFLSLITPDQSIDWKKIAKSFGILWALLFCMLAVDYILAPETFRITLAPDRFLWFAPAVLVLTPIQTTAEELFCRGYLLQMMALVTKNRVVLIIVSGILFMLPHLGNPELASGFWTMVVYYFAVGGFLAFVTLRSNGLEVAIGLHAAANLFAGLIVNYENSALKTESILFCSVFDPLGSLISFCIVAAIFYVLMFGRVTLRRPWIIWGRT